LDGGETRTAELGTSRRVPQPRASAAEYGSVARIWLRLLWCKKKNRPLLTSSLCAFATLRPT